MNDEQRREPRPREQRPAQHAGSGDDADERDAGRDDEQRLVLSDSPDADGALIIRRRLLAHC